MRKLLMLTVLITVLLVSTSCIRRVTHDYALAQDVAVQTIVDIYQHREFDKVYNSFHPELKNNASVEDLEAIVEHAAQYGTLEHVEVNKLTPLAEGVAVFLVLDFSEGSKRGQKLILIGSASEGYLVQGILKWDN